ncbi:MAG: GPR endopeptidase [Limnochordia bacterium]|jgi:spore protease|nr:GPR endopeptidase [Bacillota bacterium]NLL08729.1 GPR endopeptidase [Bacillota bacterium]HBG09166.1 GPR endopeptidase [Bacillota bacterium]
MQKQNYEDLLFSKYNIRTDLALESHQAVIEREGPPELPGVKVQTEEEAGITVTRIVVENDIGARMMGKAPGNYCTIQSSGLREHNRDLHEKTAQLLAKEIEWFFQQAELGPEDTVLVVGLGNWNATPDSLGPKVLENLMVTRHLLEMSPPELRKGLRPVAALAPGVLGLTGIETGEIIMGVVDRMGAKAVICIDALASRSVDRLCSTIQISDTGIHPGAGVGNRRLAINKETLGIPVIAIGVPTVVHAVTIISDAMNLLEGGGHDPGSSADGQPARTEFKIDPQALLGKEPSSPAPKPSVDRRQLMSQVLDPYFGSMIVTPKEIDLLIDEVADVVTGGLNTAFHEGMDYGEVFKYLS